MSSPSATSNPLSTLAPKRKTKKKHFVQQKVEVFRGSDPVLSVLMWGVNHSVGTCAASWLFLSIGLCVDAFINCALADHAQINDLSQVPVPVMLLPDDFKSSTKIKVNNHLFNKYCAPLEKPSRCFLRFAQISVALVICFACMCLSDITDPFREQQSLFTPTIPFKTTTATAPTTDNQPESSKRD